MARKTYYDESWDILAILEALAPGPEYAELTSSEVADLAGVPTDASNRNWFVYDLRQRGLIEADSPINSKRKVRRLRITPDGKHLLDIYRKEGNEAATRRLPSRPSSLARRKPSEGKKPMSRVEAFSEARNLIGTEASVDDVIKAAEFLMGDA